MLNEIFKNKNTLFFPIGTVSDKTIDFSLENGIDRGFNYVVIKYFLDNFFQGKKPIKILEVGALPMLSEEELKQMAGDTAIAAAFSIGDPRNLKYPLSSHLSRIEGSIVCANDKRKPYENINWLKSKFIQGNFLEEITQKSISNILGGNPDIIIGELVFINDLHDYENSSQENISELITKSAWNFLNKGGHLIVNNFGRFQNKHLPKILKKKPVDFYFSDAGISIYNK